MLLFFKVHSTQSTRQLFASKFPCSTFLLSLVLSQSSQFFGWALSKSDCRKLHIQIWLWPVLLREMKVWFQSSQNKFYGGSEIADQRIAAAVAQTNLGKQYLVDTLHCADKEPGEITKQKIAMIDYERNAGQKRKSSVEFKQQRRLNYLKTKSRNKSESNREEISYKLALQ